MIEVDAIIIGQGLAGSAVAATWLRYHKKIIVIDNHRPDSASGVATGLWNPVAFRSTGMAWKAPVFFPFAQTFYQKLEIELGETFWHKTGILRMFMSEKEARKWEKRSTKEPFRKWMSEMRPDMTHLSVKAPNGSGFLGHAGYMETSKYIDAFRKKLHEIGCLIHADLDYEAIKTVGDQQVQYQNYTAPHVIFCEGPQVKHNPWFKNLPFRAKKGEILTLENPGVELPCILSKGAFLLPHADGTLRLGATYNWNEEDTQPTQWAVEQLFEKLAQFFPLEAKVVRHQAGLRPTTMDKKPIIGAHPDHPALIVFNGMGSRGVTQSPWLAQHLFEYVYKHRDLDTEVAVDRYADHF